MSETTRGRCPRCGETGTVPEAGAGFAKCSLAVGGCGLRMEVVYWNALSNAVWGAEKEIEGLSKLCEQLRGENRILTAEGELLRGAFPEKGGTQEEIERLTPLVEKGNAAQRDNCQLRQEIEVRKDTAERLTVDLKCERKRMGQQKTELTEAVEYWHNEEIRAGEEIERQRVLLEGADKLIHEQRDDIVHLKKEEKKLQDVYEGYLRDNPPPPPRPQTLTAVVRDVPASQLVRADGCRSWVTLEFFQLLVGHRYGIRHVNEPDSPVNDLHIQVDGVWKLFRSVWLEPGSIREEWTPVKGEEVIGISIYGTRRSGYYHGLSKDGRHEVSPVVPYRIYDEVQPTKEA